VHAYTMTTKQKPQTARKFVFNQLVVDLLRLLHPPHNRPRMLA
jgi:hypothetical protein